MTAEEERAEVFARAQAFARLLEERKLNPDNLTGTAMVLVAAALVRRGGCSREQWLATCSSCYDAAALEGPA